MPRFRFEAMKSTGGALTDHIEAGNADEAMQMLRARGLFVAKLKEVPDDRDIPGSSERLATDASSDPSSPRPNRWLGVIFTAVGLACAAVALVGFVDVALFRAKVTERADAVILENVKRGGGTTYHDILEFSAAGKRVRVDSRGPFAILWGWSPGRAGGGQAAHFVGGKVSVLYAPDHPEDARLAAFEAQYGAPLFVLVPALLFTSVGVLIFRRGLKLDRD